MKKIVRQQNYLKELIDTQANRFLSRQALKCLLRSTLEPLMDAPESAVVLYRIDNKDGLQGLLKRLEFSEIESINYSDSSNNLKEKVWANTEFLCVLTHRFVSIIIWDNHTGDNDFVRYYSLYNSKLQYEPLDIIKRNSNIDITPYQEKFNPDRRDNILLNASIRRLLGNLEEAANDAVLGFAEKSVEVYKDSDFIQKKSRVVAHEIRNQLSICDLYSEIIRKSAPRNQKVQNAINLIQKSLKMANNSLLSLKSDSKLEIISTPIKQIIDSAVELSQVYLEGKDIEFQIENEINENILTDSESLVAVLINMVKNATEAFVSEILEENVQTDGKYIKIKTEKEENTVVISISNNAPGINEPEKIFNEGFTTKSTGSGLGLWICKISIEDLIGELELSRSTEDYTVFSIKLSIAE